MKRMKSMVVENIVETIMKYGVAKEVRNRLMEDVQEGVSFQEDLEYINNLVESFKDQVWQPIRERVQADTRGGGDTHLLRLANRVYTDLRNKQFKIEKLNNNTEKTDLQKASDKAMLYQNLLFLIQHKDSDFAEFKGIVDEGVKQGKIDASDAETWKSGWFDEADIQRRFNAARELKRLELEKPLTK